jgi:hypothetical protein
MVIKAFLIRFVVHRETLAISWRKRVPRRFL